MRRFVIDSEDVAGAILEAVEKGKREITIPWFPYRFASMFQALFPGMIGRLVGSYGYRPGVHD